MRLQLTVPTLRMDRANVPVTCPHCASRDIKFHQAVSKPVSDPSASRVEVARYRCLACRRTFRAYPPGVSNDHVSKRVKDLAVLLYLLGFNGQAVSLALSTMGQRLGQSRVYDTVRATCAQMPEQPVRMFEDVHYAMAGSDVTGVKIYGRWAPLHIRTTDDAGIVLSIEGLSRDDARALHDRLQPVVGATRAQLALVEDHLHSLPN